MNTRSKTALNNIPLKSDSTLMNSVVTIMDTIKTSNAPLYEVNIDFDEASKAWKANKKSIGNGSYKYMCCGITKTGNKCNRQSLDFVHYCKIHDSKSK
jgi:hypothetical protein